MPQRIPVQQRRSFTTSFRKHPTRARRQTLTTEYRYLCPFPPTRTSWIPVLLPASHMFPGVSPVTLSCRPRAFPPLLVSMPRTPLIPSQSRQQPVPHCSPHRCCSLRPSQLHCVPVPPCPAVRRPACPLNPCRLRSHSLLPPSAACPSSQVPSRFFCPVPSCHDHAPSSHGWARSTACSHVDAHLAGQLTGDISLDWLRSQASAFVRCVNVSSACGSMDVALHVSTSSLLVLTARSPPPAPLRRVHRGVGRFSPAARRFDPRPPKGAREAWSRHLIMSLAEMTHGDVRTWTDFLTLPTLVLAAPSRGGRRQAARQDNATRRECLDWIGGIRADLSAPVDSSQDKRRSSPSLFSWRTPSKIRWPRVCQPSSPRGSPAHVCCLGTRRPGPPDRWCCVRSS